MRRMRAVVLLRMRAKVKVGVGRRRIGATSRRNKGKEFFGNFHLLFNLLELACLITSLHN